MSSTISSSPISPNNHNQPIVNSMPSAYQMSPNMQINPNVYQPTMQQQQFNQTGQILQANNSIITNPNSNYQPPPNTMYIQQQPCAPNSNLLNNQIVTQQQNINQNSYGKIPEDQTYISNSNAGVVKPNNFVQPALSQVSIENGINNPSIQMNQQQLMASPMLNNNVQTNNNYQLNSYNNFNVNNLNKQSNLATDSSAVAQNQTLSTSNLQPSQVAFIQPSNIQMIPKIDPINQNQNIDIQKTNLDSLYQNNQSIPSTLNLNQALPTNALYTVNNTVSFLGQQQQLISENLNNSNKETNSLNTSLENNKSPGKKLTKKQLLQQSLTTDDSDTSPIKKAQRKIRPKKDSLNNSLSSSSSVNDLTLLNNSAQHALLNTSIDTFKPVSDSNGVESETTAISASTNGIEGNNSK